MYHKIYHTNNNSNDCLGETSVSRYDVSLISKDCASLAIKIFQELHHWWRSHFFNQMKVICKGDIEKSLEKENREENAFFQTRSSAFVILSV